ncbi:OmpA family protein [Adhaeribacter rhizoryzae]|uniref:OmpA family protein n=1 Tax=Adhaeribacter rhizoryzae TaxID=2607907 RepID=A0A5M6CVH9_9BACT|nr:OmpA family protein [Adhaeribacter rhizoryzae]KAA5539234.1 OmpA family protein [Adhaeribacter rhizoryzae]
MKKITKNFTYALLSLGLLATSCVSSKKYETALAINRELQANRDALSKEKAALEEERSTLAKEKAALEEEKNATEKSLKANLQSSNQRVNQLSSDLQAQEDRLREMQRILAEKDRAVNDLKNRVSQALLGFKAGDLTVNVKNGKVYVSLSEQLLFKSGSTKVDPKGQDALQKLAFALKDQPDVNVLIEGHTDDVPIAKGTVGMKDNWDLSVLRATEIARIVTNAGLAPERVTPSGHSKYVPVVANTNPESRQLNRRTEIILTPKLDELFKILEQN